MDGPDLVVGGVPEHFNMPWTQGASGVQFEEVGEGSGAMLRGVQEGRFDGILALTECVVAEAYRGSSVPTNVEIVGTYVASTLPWAVNVSAQSGLQSIDQLRGKRFGISREGSGSHVMASVMARENGWDEGLEFVVIGNFAKLREALNSGRCDVFLWEKFTSKPYHESGELCSIDVVETRWPCFVLAARKGSPRADELRRALNSALENAQKFKANEDDWSVRAIVSRFGLREEDARLWLESVAYPSGALAEVSETALRNAFEALRSAGVVADGCAFDARALLAPGSELVS